MSNSDGSGDYNSTAWTVVFRAPASSMSLFSRHLLIIGLMELQGINTPVETDS